MFTTECRECGEEAIPEWAVEGETVEADRVCLYEGTGPDGSTQVRAYIHRNDGEEIHAYRRAEGEWGGGFKFVTKPPEEFFYTEDPPESYSHQGREDKWEYWGIVGSGEFEQRIRDEVEDEAWPGEGICKAWAE